jgi:hypothetical protein
MTLGAIAELKVKDYKVLHDPLMHRIPTKMQIQRMLADQGLINEKKAT